MEHLVKNIEQYDTKSFYEHETKVALLRRLIPLIEGEGKRAFVVGRAVGIGEIAEKPCVVALGDLKDAELRNLLGVMLLALIYELRLSEGPSSLKHVTIIEESQNVVPYRLRTEDATIFEKMFFEMRKYGESLVLLAQFPTQIFPDVVKSAGIKVVHRLTEAGEAEMIMDVMGLSRSLYSQLKYLPEGRAVVLTDNLDGPITVQIPLLETHSPTSQLQLTHPMSKA